MNKLAPASSYGVLIEPATLKMERLLPGPIERVWAYLTQSDLRSQWMAAGDMPMTIDPTHRLAITWDGSDTGSFELEPRGKYVLLTIIHRRLADRAAV